MVFKRFRCRALENSTRTGRNSKMLINMDDSDTGNIYDKLRFNAQSGRWSVRTHGDDTDINKTFDCVFNMRDIETGWARFNGTFLEFVAESPDSGARPPVTEGSEDPWKRAFRVLAFSTKVFGGVVQFMSSARVVISAMNDLHQQFEQDSDEGGFMQVKVFNDPVKVPTKKGDLFSPNWQKVKMMGKKWAFPTDTPTVEDVEDDEFPV